MAPQVVAIIGGSALGDAFELEDEQAKFLVTPHGAPSDPPRMGKHGAATVVFLALASSPTVTSVTRGRWFCGR